MLPASSLESEGGQTGTNQKVVQRHRFERHAEDKVYQRTPVVLKTNKDMTKDIDLDIKLLLDQTKDAYFYMRGEVVNGQCEGMYNYNGDATTISYLLLAACNNDKGMKRAILETAANYLTDNPDEIIEFTELLNPAHE